MPSTSLEDFANLIAQDPHILNTIKKRAELEAFKERYHVERSSPLKCPSCSQWGQTGGSLWRDPSNPKRFVCRKCHLSWFLDCGTLPLEDLILKMKEAQKQ